MGLYRLIKKRGNYVGLNEDGKRVTYEGGDTVPSEHDLVRIFPNRFVRISGLQENGNVEVEQPDIPVPGPKIEDAVSPETKTEPEAKED